MGWDPYRMLRGSAMTSENAEPGTEPAPVGGPTPVVVRARQGIEKAFTGLEVDFSGKIGIGDLVKALQANTNAVEAIQPWLSSNPRPLPIGRILRTNLAGNAAAPTFSVVQFQQPFDTGGPNAGYRWEVGAHFIWGTDPFTVVGGSSAALYAGAAPPVSGANLPGGDIALDSSVRYSVTTLPWGGSFPPHSVFIQPGDSIYYVVKSIGNNQQINAALLVWEYREGVAGGWL